MTIHQIMQIVHTHPQEEIVFFKEGIFRRCYNMHAFYFTQNIKPMQVSTRFIKKVNRYIHIIGFPETALTKYIQQLEKDFGARVTETTPSYTRLSLDWKSEINYKLWRDGHIQSLIEKQRPKDEERVSQILNQHHPHKPAKEYISLVKKIKDFPIEKATPLEAFNFVQKIKKYADECPLSEAI